MLFNATVFEIKINKPTSRNLLQISCQTIDAVEDRTSYSSLVMVTTIMWLFWEITRLLCDTWRVSWGKSLHFLFSLKLTYSTMDVNFVIKLLSWSSKMLDQNSTK